MRDIKFRGKRKTNGVWVYGKNIMIYKDAKTDEERGVYMCQTGDRIMRSLVCVEKNGVWLEQRQFPYIEIDPETVGECTGLHDKNGKEIYEGDRVQTHGGIVGVIQFGAYYDDEDGVNAYGYYWLGSDEYGDDYVLGLSLEWKGHSVIGNIHDNPELMEDIK